ncbi:DUF4870 domain-containing protein [Candidatus Micrarchaeota archaeon]|nr:DUF4870 domain-containing protein [Candidatus Micrarchaeota archaeon]MBD3417639.1 DUF4870 domain-containing protein [Candidatus Micrarchaeota archaeon]
MAEKKPEKKAEAPAAGKPVEKKPAAPPTGGGNESNLLAAAGYIVGLIAIIMYLVKKEDKFLRFHAMQSILLWVGAFVVAFVLWILSAVIGMVPVIGVLGCVFGFLGLAIWLVAVVAALYCAYKAFEGEKYELPYIGPMARKYE